MAKGDFTAFDHTQLAAGFEFIRHWPESLFAHIGRVGRGRFGLRKDVLGRLGKYLHPQAPRTPLQSLLEKEIPSAVARAGLPVKRQQGQSNAWRGDGAITQKEAIALFGINRTTLNRLRDSETCVISSKTTYSGVALWDRNALSNTVETWRGSLTYEQAASSIGAPVYIVEELVCRGLLDAVLSSDVALLSDNAPLVSKASVEGMRHAICYSSHGSSPPSDYEKFRVAMAGILHPSTWVAIIELLISGSLSHTAALEGPKFLHSIHLPNTALDAFRLTDEVLPIPNFDISGSVAADLLAVSNTLLSGAVAIGLLAGRRDRTCTKVSLSEARRYRTEFIASQEVERRIGLKAQAFANAMRQAGVEPAAKIHSTTLWRRLDVDAIFQSQSL